MVATTLPSDKLLDLPVYVGQRACSFKFFLIDFPTKQVIKELTPLRDSVPVLEHDTSRTITRQVSNLYFDKKDTAQINSIRHRVKIQMIFEGRTPYDLGTFMYLSQDRLKSTAGLESTTTMVDSMFIVDQQLETTYAAGTFNPDGTVVSFRQVDAAIGDVLQGIPVAFTTEPTSFYSIGVWEAGSQRGSTLEDLSIDGDYFSPWFDATDIMRFIRSFDPATKIPKFDFDSGYRVDRDSIIFTDNLIDAPNRFVVVSNGSVSQGALPVVGSYDVPASAPHSILNRGFVIPEIIDWQVDFPSQAAAIAANIGQRQTIFETVEFTTPPDPRHDSYDVFQFSGVNWMELRWSMELIEGGSMAHTGRRSYI